MHVYPRYTLASPQRDDLNRPGSRFRREELPPPGTSAPRVRIPVRGSSVLTGLARSCSAELIGFASPIGRLSAILRITDVATGITATSVVPVDLHKPVEGGARPPEMIVPESDVRARDLRAETERVRLVPSIRGGALSGELLTMEFDGLCAHGLALVLSRALRAGALTSVTRSEEHADSWGGDERGAGGGIEQDMRADVGPKRRANDGGRIQHDRTDDLRI